MDAVSLRAGTTGSTLKGAELRHFAGFLSQSLRECDYLWGRLDGAERLIDIVCDAARADISLDALDIKKIKNVAFRCILDAEEKHLQDKSWSRPLGPRSTEKPGRQSRVAAPRRWHRRFPIRRFSAAIWRPAPDSSVYFCRVASIASRCAKSVTAPAFTWRMNSSIGSLVALSSIFHRLMTICDAPT